MQFTHPWQRNDWIALEMARRIATRLLQNPALIDSALNWMSALRAKGRDFVAHREWEDIIKKTPLEGVAQLLVREDDEGQRLRSSHPFQGVLPDSERREIIAHAFAI